MSNRFDHLAKQIGREALGPSGPTIAHDEINAETQYADLRHEPTPGRQADRDRAGLLGRLASSFCLIEVYSEAPGEEDFRACLSKHLTSWRGRTRKTENDNRKLSQQGLPPEPFVDPFLWIIAAGEPTTVLTELELKPEPYWPAGVYLFGADILRVGIVVASELPRDDPSTLLVRLMAAGPLLAHAVKELAALPPDAYERVVAEPILLNLPPFAHSGDASSRTLNPRYSNVFRARLATPSLRAPAHTRSTSPGWECAAARPGHRGPHRRLRQRRATGSRLAKRRPLAAWP